MSDKRIVARSVNELFDVFGKEETHKELHSRLLLLLALTAILALGVILALGISGYGWGQAVEWTTSQLLVGGSSHGSGPAEHVLEPLMQAWSLTAVAAVAGSFAAFFHRRSLENRPLPRTTNTAWPDKAVPDR